MKKPGNIAAWIYLFAAKLTQMKEPVTFSEKHEASTAAEIADVFCKENGLDEPAWSDENSLKFIHRQEFAKAFQKDPEFRQSYVANVAMLIHDDQNGDNPTDLSTHEGYNDLAERLVHKIFES